MNKLVLLIFLFRIPTCVNPDQNGFVDGTDLSKTNEFKNYELYLNTLVTVPDSMVNGIEPVIPPNSNLDNRLIQDTMVDGTIQIRVYTSDDREIYFRDLFDPVTYEDVITYRFRGFDSRNGIIYMVENRKKDNYFRFFGICLNNGNQFTVYDKDSRGINERMFSWKFSPDMKYLLKSGDLDNDTYGWSLVNLGDGVEGKAYFERYDEFITDIKWTGNDQFSYVLTKIPFKPGHKYDKDYEFFYSIMNGNPIPWIQLNGDVIYPVRYTLDVKGHLLSEKLLKIQL